MVWYGKVWYGMVWYGVVWYGMVWYGMIWYGKVWYGMVTWFGAALGGMGWNKRRRLRFPGGVFFLVLCVSHTLFVRANYLCCQV